MFRQGDVNNIGFKEVLYAVILNDMKEWEEYRSKEVHKVEPILKKFLMNHKSFSIERFLEDLLDYKNINTPQSNYTWNILSNSKVAHPIKVQ